MASIVQAKGNTAWPGSSITCTLDSAATNGNHLIIFGYGSTQLPTGATFNGNSATLTSSYDYGLFKIWAYKVVESGVSSVIVSFAGSANCWAMAFEVSGLADPYVVDFETPADGTASGSFNATGEGTATSHSMEYTSTTACMAFAYVQQGNNRTLTGANGATAYPMASAGPVPWWVVAKSVSSGAGSVDFTVDVSSAWSGVVVGFQDAAAGTANIPEFMHHRKQQGIS